METSAPKLPTASLHTGSNQRRSVTSRLLKGIALVNLSCLLAACGSDTTQEFVSEQIAEAALGDTGVEVDVNVDGDTVSWEVDGEYGFSYTSGIDITLPDSFPSDVLIYNDATLISSVETDEVLSVTFTSGDKAPKIQTAYVEFFDNEGWSREGQMQVEGMSVLMYKKAERSASLNIIEADDEPTSVSLSLSR